MSAQGEPIFGTFDNAYEVYRSGMIHTGGAMVPGFENDPTGAVDFPPGLAPREFYARLFRAFERLPLSKRGLTYGYTLEAEWYGEGSPEYLIHEPAVEALSRTKIDVPTDMLRLPFKAMMLRFPKGLVRESPGSPALDAAIFTETVEAVFDTHIKIKDATGGISTFGREKKNAPPVRKLVLMCCFDGKDDTEKYNYVKFALDQPTIEACFAKARLRTEDPDITPEEALDTISGYWPSRECYHRILQIAAGVALFATGARKDMVTPRRLPRQERRRIAKETGERTRDVERPSWDVGKAIKLPRPEVEAGVYQPEATAACAACSHTFEVHGRGKCPAQDCGCSGFDTGRHLRHAHLRSGHWHHYCVGPRADGSPGTDYVLRWVAPTLVRADLPFAPGKRPLYEVPKGEK